ncbi:MAG: hypothetical protein [Cressdnaviricota sp.]|nr:MAG: hypothetical protein [Cressdnaviricota sp.]
MVVGFLNTRVAPSNICIMFLNIFCIISTKLTQGYLCCGRPFHFFNFNLFSIFHISFLLYKREFQIMATTSGLIQLVYCSCKREITLRVTGGNFQWGHILACDISESASFRTFHLSKIIISTLRSPNP